MAKERFDRSKPHVNIGTIGTVGPNEMIHNQLMLHSILQSTKLPKPVLLCEELGGGIVGAVDKIDYSETEKRIMAHISCDIETVNNLINPSTFVSFSSRCGKTYLRKQIEELLEERLGESEIKPIVPVSVYKLISSW